MAFARDAHANSDRLPEAMGLRWRRRVGPELCPYMQPILLTAVYKRVRNIMWWRRWAREGY